MRMRTKMAAMSLGSMSLGSMSLGSMALTALLMVVPAEVAQARGGGLDLGGRGGAGGAPVRPNPRPPVPGVDRGDRGGSLLERRRARTKRLEELGATETPQAARTPVTPTPARGPLASDEPAGPAPTPDTSLVHLHHETVQMFEGLARVDLTLEVQNVGESVMEWRRDYAIDPSAEVIGAVLLRRNQLPIVARTMTTPDALACYARVRMPPQRPTPTPQPRRPRDPLLVQRTAPDELHIRIWPIAAGETLRVELTFVTPLGGQGARRTYRDVMGGPQPEMRRTPDRGERAPRETGSAGRNADWVVDPGTLVLASAEPMGMQLNGRAGGQLKFTGRAATRPDEPAPSLPFLARTRSAQAQLVGTRTIHQRVAVVRFDPVTYLKDKGFVLTRGMALELHAVRGQTRRIAPRRFDADGAARPITMQVVDGQAETLRFGVRVLDRSGTEVLTFDEALPLARPDLDDAMQDAVEGWHRAQLARRVFDWAGADTARQAEAVRYAVDLGVLVPGSCAIAIPALERARLTPRLRRLYRSDGVPLGAARREADVKQPPHGALDDDFEAGGR